MDKDLQEIYSELIKLAAEMIRHEGEPSTYIEELKFCKSTPFKDKIRRAQDNECNYNLSHRRGNRIVQIANKLRKRLTVITV